MAAVYKSISKTNGVKSADTTFSVKRNKQRVLILSSRGVTYRSALKTFELCDVG